MKVVFTAVFLQKIRYQDQLEHGLHHFSLKELVLNAIQLQQIGVLR
jgi:hypothetical protein